MHKKIYFPPNTKTFWSKKISATWWFNSVAIVLIAIVFEFVILNIDKKRTSTRKGPYVSRVVILGAGLTGLSAAYHFEKNNFFDFKIFEQESTCGGLARSVKHKHFTFDFTGHFLHCNNNYFSHFRTSLTL